MPLDNSPSFHMIELGTTRSTNDFLHDYRPPRLPEMTLVTADYQTAGRGQTGNSWEAQPGQNLLFSILVHPTFLAADSVFAISEAIALAIREAIESMLAGATPKAPYADGNHTAPSADDNHNAPSTDDNHNAPSTDDNHNAPSTDDNHTAPSTGGRPSVTVKWPNDIYVGSSKIAGILIENNLSGNHLARSIIGCGININQTAFAFATAAAPPSPAPSSQPHTATSSQLHNATSSQHHNATSSQPHTAPSSPLLSTPPYHGGTSPSTSPSTSTSPAPSSPAPPISLALLTGRPFERSFVLDAVVGAFRRRYAQLQAGHEEALHAEYHAHLYRSQGMHPFADAGGPFRASISHVEPSGHIVLSDEDHRLRRYAFKEVAFVSE